MAVHRDTQPVDSGPDPQVHSIDTCEPNKEVLAIIHIPVRKLLNIKTHMTCRVVVMSLLSWQWKRLSRLASSHKLPRYHRGTELYYLYVDTDEYMHGLGIL